MTAEEERDVRLEILRLGSGFFTSFEIPEAMARLEAMWEFVTGPSPLRPAQASE